MKNTGLVLLSYRTFDRLLKSILQGSKYIKMSLPINLLALEMECSRYEEEEKTQEASQELCLGLCAVMTMTCHSLTRLAC